MAAALAERNVPAVAMAAVMGSADASPGKRRNTARATRETRYVFMAISY
jgi:hypothetical protein